jgi:hypothetical protein
MTELSFLLDLLLNNRLDRAVKGKITARITQVEQDMSLPQAIKQQQRNQQQVTSVDNVAQTAATAQALANRQAAIDAAVNQKPMEVATGNGTKGPRKF